MGINVYKKIIRLKEHIRQLKIELSYYENVHSLENQKMKIDEIIRSYITTHQQKVINCILKGNSIAETAAELNISPKTVKYHLTRIYALLNIEGKYDLIGLYSNKEILNAIQAPTERIVEAAKGKSNSGIYLAAGTSRQTVPNQNN